MSKSFAILLSITLSFVSCGSAFAQYQYQDPRLAGQAQPNDGLDAIYDAINAQARQSVVNADKPVRDQRSYNQFMDRTSADLNVELNNTAKTAAARQRDAAITGAYEQKRIDDLAAWEKTQVQSASSTVRRGRHVYNVPNNSYDNNNGYTDNSYVYGGGPAAAQFQGIDGRRQLGLSQSQDNVNSRIEEGQALAERRSQVLEDAANSLRDQVLSTQGSAKQFGLQGVGTNLYVRQYGKPDADLPPVHNASARIVPLGYLDH